MSADSTVSPVVRKPRADFPLFPHQTGRWAKKVKGKLHYFGKTADDPNGVRALTAWLEQKDDLLAGRQPRAKLDGLTVADLVNGFLTAKKARCDTGELQARSFQDYYIVCERIVEVFGRDRAVIDLGTDDFAKLRASFAATRGPVALSGDVTRARTVFKWGFDEGLLLVPMRYGQSFDRPSRKTIRVARSNAGPRMFERDECLAVLNAATQPLKAMLLLGLNAGLGNSDVAKLPLKAVDLERGWLSFPRPKTGVSRKIPLWAETISSLREWLAVRPVPKNEAAADLVFVTRSGGSWYKTVADNPLCKEFAKLLKRLGMHSEGRNFYSLRRTFRTIASEARDEPAANHIMGHSPRSDDMASLYTQRIDDDRLRAVADHVRRWLFGGEPAGGSADATPTNTVSQPAPVKTKAKRQATTAARAEGLGLRLIG